MPTATRTAAAPKTRTTRKPAGPETPRLTAAQREEIRGILEDDLKQAVRSARGSEQALREQLEASGRLGGDVTDSSIDMGAAEAANISVNRANDQMATLRDALTRLATQGERFGICEACQTPIAFERLEVVPATRVCARHA